MRLQELFGRMGTITTCQVLYDRSDRSRGTAYVTYTTLRDANRAIREFDGANAYGQPIKLTLLPSGPAASGRGARMNPFDVGVTRATNSRSLFDRIDDSAGGGRRRGRRSESPVARERRDDRRSDVTRPPPEHIDRYVPGDRARSRSPLPARRGERGQGRGPRGGDARGGGRDRDSRPAVQGRPRKTAEELDAEMNDYWGSAGAEKQAGETSAANGAAPASEVPVGSVGAGDHIVDDDVDMII